MPFLFCYNGPLCGDGRGEELCVAAVRTLPRAPRRGGPRGAGRGEGPGWS